ncbi:MAG: hypothetical protein ACOC32_03090 [Nanoarchaeota archaeon]
MIAVREKELVIEMYRCDRCERWLDEEKKFLNDGKYTKKTIVCETCHIRLFHHEDRHIFTKTR